MPNTKDRVSSEALYLIENAPMLEERTGQLLFNNLRHEVANQVRGTDFDPFYKDLTYQEIVDWLNNDLCIQR